MERTLNAVARKGEASAIEVGKLIGWDGKESALNNRLRRLFDFGLLKRERKGPHLLYSIASTK